MLALFYLGLGVRRHGNSLRFGGVGRRVNCFTLAVEFSICVALTGRLLAKRTLVLNLRREVLFFVMNFLADAIEQLLFDLAEVIPGLHVLF